jgi:hypothetical protein
MKIFKSYTFTWWQIGIFKIALLAAGIAVGAYWHSFFGTILPVLIVIAAITTLYIIYVSLSSKDVH